MTIQLCLTYDFYDNCKEKRTSECIGFVPKEGTECLDSRNCLAVIQLERIHSSSFDVCIHLLNNSTKIILDYADFSLLPESSAMQKREFFLKVESSLTTCGVNRESLGIKSSMYQITLLEKSSSIRIEPNGLSYAYCRFNVPINASVGTIDSKKEYFDYTNGIIIQDLDVSVGEMVNGTKKEKILIRGRTSNKAIRIPNQIKSSNKKPYDCKGKTNTTCIGLIANNLTINEQRPAKCIQNSNCDLLIKIESMKDNTFEWSLIASTDNETSNNVSLVLFEASKRPHIRFDDSSIRDFSTYLPNLTMPSGKNEPKVGDLLFRMESSPHSFPTQFCSILQYDDQEGEKGFVYREMTNNLQVVERSRNFKVGKKDYAICTFKSARTIDQGKNNINLESKLMFYLKTRYRKTKKPPVDALINLSNVFRLRFASIKASTAEMKVYEDCQKGEKSVTCLAIKGNSHNFDKDEPSNCLVSKDCDVIVYMRTDGRSSHFHIYVTTSPKSIQMAEFFLRNTNRQSPVAVEGDLRLSLINSIERVNSTECAVAEFQNNDFKTLDQNATNDMNAVKSIRFLKNDGESDFSLCMFQAPMVINKRKTGEIDLTTPSKRNLTFELIHMQTTINGFDEGTFAIANHVNDVPVTLWPEYKVPPPTQPPPKVTQKPSGGEGGGGEGGNATAAEGSSSLLLLPMVKISFIIQILSLTSSWLLKC